MTSLSFSYEGYSAEGKKGWYPKNSSSTVMPNPQTSSAAAPRGPAWALGANRSWLLYAVMPTVMETRRGKPAMSWKILDSLKSPILTSPLEFTSTLLGFTSRCAML
jgi:hypothetical protein